MKTYRLKASSIQNYEMLVKAKSEEEAYEYASLNSGSWKEIASEDWQDEGCEEVIERIDEMITQDKKTGEHPNATLADYIGWATEEIKLNK